MKVVFMEEVEGTARVGEVRNVADGFARNYLLPRKLAAPATDHYINIATARAEKEARRQARVDDEAREHLVPKVEGRSLSIEVRVGEQGKLFGSVTGRDIAEALQELTGVELEHKQVDLRQPIREVGAHEVTVNLTRNVPVQVTVNVEPLGGMPEEGEGEEVEEAPEGEEAVEASADTSAEAVEGEPETAEGPPEAAAESAVEGPAVAESEEPAEEPAAAEEPVAEAAPEAELAQETSGGEAEEAVAAEGEEASAGEDEEKA